MLAICQTIAVLDRIIGSAKLKETHLHKFLDPTRRVIFHVELAAELMFYELWRGWK